MKIYIDSDVFVSYVKRNENNHKSSKEFLDFITKKNLSKFEFFTSRFTEVEVGSAVNRRSNYFKNQARATLHKITRGWADKIFLLPENPSEKIKIDSLIIKLVETALKYGTTFGDTIHANDVESYEIDYLVTWNLKDFKKLEKKIKKLKVVTPTDILKQIKKKEGKEK